MLADLLGRLGGLLREGLHLLRDDGKAAAGLTGTGRLDGRIQRQKIGLSRDRLDQIDDGRDALGRLGETFDLGFRPRRGRIGIAHRGVGELDLAADLDNGARKLFSRRRDGLHVDCGLLRGAGCGSGLLGGVTCDPRQRFRGAPHHADIVVHLGQQLRRFGAEGLHGLFHVAVHRFARLGFTNIV